MALRTPVAVLLGLLAFALPWTGPAQPRVTIRLATQSPLTAGPALGGDEIRLGAQLALEQLDDLEHGHVARRAGEAVAALHPPLGLQDARAAQRGEQALQELRGDVAGAGEVADRHRCRVAAARQLGESAQRVGRLASDHQHAV